MNRKPQETLCPVSSIHLRCELPGKNISDYLSTFLNRLHLGTLYTGFNLPVSRSKVASRLLSPSPAPTVHQVTCFCWCVCVMFWMFWWNPISEYVQFFESQSTLKKGRHPRAKVDKQWQTHASKKNLVDALPSFGAEIMKSHAASQHCLLQYGHHVRCANSWRLLSVEF